MFKKTQDEIELEKLLVTEKDQLLATYQKSCKDEELMLGIFINSINHAKFNEFNDDKIVWNMSGYVNLISLDLRYLTKDMVLTDSEWNKRLMGRMGSMLIYEALTDLQRLFGSELNGILSKLSKKEELLAEINPIRKSLNEYRIKYQDRLVTIRNVATAHRDRDLLEQFNVITSIGWMETITYFHEFVAILKSSGTFLQKLINLSVEEFDKSKKPEL